ncbi:MAG: class I SAM-dependent methyltransferase [Patescibacteria group bacterium]|jgi:SAM-dependent methyltransferase
MWAYLILIILLAALLPVAFAGLSLAPWVPMWKKDLERVMQLAELKPGETFYDLGCGDGKVVLYAARHYQANAIGVEIAWPLWLVCQIKKLLIWTPKAKFKLGNLFKTNVSDADVVYVFGMPKTIQQKLQAKLDRELKPGARVISYSFAFHGWEPYKKDKPTKHDLTIYCYKR